MNRALTAAVALGLLLTGCTGAADPAAEPDATSTATSPAPTPTDDGADPTEGDETLPPVRHPDSLPALMRREWTASRLRLGEVVDDNPAYTRRQVSYRSGGLRVTGVLLRPKGPGPFPGLVMNHGYIEPSVYVSGQGLSREQDWFARRGFVVLHTDYRGHAGSEDGPAMESRLGYTIDTIHAVLALERERYVDADRMAMLGRSMGGGVTLNALVAYPGLVRAAVVYSSVSSDLRENLRHFTRTNRPRALHRLYRRVGTPADNPSWFRDNSARSFFDRVSDPVLLHHGSDDGTCPVRWSRQTHRLLRRAGAPSRYAEYPGEGHTFGPLWAQSMERSARFIRSQFR